MDTYNNEAKNTMARPLAILEMTEDSIKLNDKAIHSVLDKVRNRPFVVWSMNGQTRTGKSFLLNYFVRYFEFHKNNPSYPHNNSSESNWLDYKTQEFPWRGGKQRTTIGIDLWSEPYFIQTSGGEVAVLLMDTQGLFDDQTTVRQNAIIYSISVLFSSVMIFNQMHNMNEDFLQKIQFFSQYAHAATSHSSQNSVPLKDLFQKLLFVIRDFSYPSYEFCPHHATMDPAKSPKNFFNETFMIDNRPAGYPEENKMVRKSILEIFESIIVYPLPDPGRNFKRLAQDPEKSKIVQPDEEFQETVKSFIEWMVWEENLEKKKIFGRELNVHDFKSFINNCKSLCTNAEDTFPVVHTLAESTAITHYTIAKQLAFTFYAEQFECQYGTPKWMNGNVDIEKIHAEALPASIEIFHRAPKIAVYNDQFKKDFLLLLESEIKQHYDILKETYESIKQAAILKQDYRMHHKMTGVEDEPILPSNYGQPSNGPVKNSFMDGLKNTWSAIKRNVTGLPLNSTYPVPQDTVDTNFNPTQECGVKTPEPTNTRHDPPYPNNVPGQAQLASHEGQPESHAASTSSTRNLSEGSSAFQTVKYQQWKGNPPQPYEKQEKIAPKLYSAFCNQEGGCNNYSPPQNNVFKNHSSGAPCPSPLPNQEVGSRLNPSSSYYKQPPSLVQNHHCSNNAEYLESHSPHNTGPNGVKLNSNIQNSFASSHISNRNMASSPTGSNIKLMMDRKMELLTLVDVETRKIESKSNEVLEERRKLFAAFMDYYTNRTSRTNLDQPNKILNKFIEDISYVDKKLQKCEIESSKLQTKLFAHQKEEHEITATILALHQHELQ